MKDEIKTKQITYEIDQRPEETEGSRKEARSFSEGIDSEKETETNEHEKKENLRAMYANLLRRFMYVMMVLAIISVITLFLHLILPDKWHWMTAKQMEKLFTILTRGLIASILAGAF